MFLFSLHEDIQSRLLLSLLTVTQLRTQTLGGAVDRGLIHSENIAFLYTFGKLACELCSYTSGCLH